MTPEVCPNCGADVPPGARACPACGSCAETGWSGEPEGGGLDLPEEGFDYDEYVRREFGPAEKGRAGGGGGHPALWCGGTILFLVVLWLLFH